jgi:hypothetical protein
MTVAFWRVCPLMGKPQAHGRLEGRLHVKVTFLLVLMDEEEFVRKREEDCPCAANTCAIGVRCHQLHTVEITRGGGGTLKRRMC